MFRRFESIAPTVPDDVLYMRSPTMAYSASDSTGAFLDRKVYQKPVDCGKQNVSSHLFLEHASRGLRRRDENAHTHTKCGREKTDNGHHYVVSGFKIK